MTKRLEELFQFDKLENQDDTTNSTTQTVEETKQAIIEIDATIDKIDAALPAVRDLESSDKELDELAELATESFNLAKKFGYVLS